MISIHHEKQITGSGRENSQPFWLFNLTWTLRECIDIIDHIFVATNEAIIHKKTHYCIKNPTQICKVNNLPGLASKLMG